MHDATLRAGGSAAEMLRRLTQWEISLLTRCVQMHTEALEVAQQPAAATAAPPPLFAATETEDDEAFEREMQATWLTLTLALTLALSLSLSLTLSLNPQPQPRPHPNLEREMQAALELLYTS